MKKRGFMKKGEFGKKGVAKIIEVILLILIAIIAIFLIWWLIVGFFGEQEEISGLKTKMLVEEMHINDDIDFRGVDSIMLTVTKGPGKQVVTGTTTEFTPPPSVDVLSVVDLSGSMRGTKLSAAKEANNVFIKSILEASVDCDVENNPDKKACCNDKKNCINGADCITCGGTPISKNGVGIVGYGTEACFTWTDSESVVQSVCEDLSPDLEYLNSLVSSWKDDTLKTQMTCICCGINKAVELLEYSSKTKVIVVMSDGFANRNCTNTADFIGTEEVLVWKNDRATYPLSIKSAIESAENAKDKKITVYSVGFGNGMVDKETLKNIATIGGGTYSDADPSTISEVYAEIGKKIIQTFATENFAHLKIMLYDDGGESCEKRIYETDVPGIPGPLESRDYTITFDVAGSDCPNMIKDEVARIEIYPVLLTSTGTQVIGPALDIWEKSA